LARDPGAGNTSEAAHLGRPQEALLCVKAKQQQQMFSVAKAKRQQQMFSVAKAKRQQQMFSVAKAKRQLQSARPERKSTSRYGDEPNCLYPIFLTLFS